MSVYTNNNSHQPLSIIFDARVFLREESLLEASRSVLSVVNECLNNFDQRLSDKSVATATHRKTSSSPLPPPLALSLLLISSSQVHCLLPPTLLATPSAVGQAKAAMRQLLASTSSSSSLPSSSSSNNTFLTQQCYIGPRCAADTNSSATANRFLTTTTTASSSTRDRRASKTSSLNNNNKQHLSVVARNNSNNTQQRMLQNALEHNTRNLVAAGVNPEASVNVIVSSVGFTTDSSSSNSSSSSSHTSGGTLTTDRRGNFRSSSSSSSASVAWCSPAHGHTIAFSVTERTLSVSKTQLSPSLSLCTVPPDPVVVRRASIGVIASAFGLSQSVPSIIMFPCSSSSSSNQQQQALRIHCACSSVNLQLSVFEALGLNQNDKIDHHQHQSHSFTQQQQQQSEAAAITATAPPIVWKATRFIRTSSIDEAWICGTACCFRPTGFNTAFFSSTTSSSDIKSSNNSNNNNECAAKPPTSDAGGNQQDPPQQNDAARPCSFDSNIKSSTTSDFQLNQRQANLQRNADRFYAVHSKLSQPRDGCGQPLALLIEHVHHHHSNDSEEHVNSSSTKNIHHAILVPSESDRNCMLLRSLIPFESFRHDAVSMVPSATEQLQQHSKNSIDDGAVGCSSSSSSSLAAVRAPVVDYDFSHALCSLGTSHLQFASLLQQPF